MEISVDILDIELLIVYNKSNSSVICTATVQNHTHYEHQTLVNLTCMDANKGQIDSIPFQTSYTLMTLVIL